MSGPSIFTPFLWVAFASWMFWVAMTNVPRGNPLGVILPFAAFVAGIHLVVKTADYWSNR